MPVDVYVRHQAAGNEAGAELAVRIIVARPACSTGVPGRPLKKRDGPRRSERFTADPFIAACPIAACAAPPRAEP